jgi:hypothetical protein
MNTDEFVQVQSAPRYMVARNGEIFSINRPETPLKHQRLKDGSLSLRLNCEGVTKTLLVRRIVAEAFCPGRNDIFNTVIHKDCNKDNCNADNLVWRPRSFAFDYIKQFQKTGNGPDSWRKHNPILCVDTGVVYNCVFDACYDLGLLAWEVVMSAMNPPRTTMRYSFEYLDPGLRKWLYED